MLDDDLLTIGVFARAADVTASALRFYDDCGLVRPVAVDPANGYRYYSPGQVAEVVFIRRLREAGLPLADVRRVLGGPPEVAERVLADHLRGMEQAVQAALTAVRERAAAGIPGRERATAGIPGRKRATAGVPSREPAPGIPGPVLAEAVRQVAPAAAAGGAVPVLGGVLIEVDAGEVRLVATDRFRLAMRSLRPGGTAGSAVVAAADLLAATSWFERQAAVRIEPGARFVSAAAERTLPVLAGPYPDYRGMLDRLPRPRATVVAPLHRLRAEAPEDGIFDLAVDGNPGIDGDPGVNGDPGIDGDPSVGGDPGIVSFDAAQWRAALDAGLGPDLWIGIAAPDLPVVLRSADDGDYTLVMMPVLREEP